MHFRLLFMLWQAKRLSHLGCRLLYSLRLLAQLQVNSFRCSMPLAKTRECGGKRNLA
jgi:hypothetical protein